MTKKNPAAIALPVLAASVAGAFGLWRWNERRQFRSVLESEKYSEEHIAHLVPDYVPWFGFSTSGTAKLTLDAVEIEQGVQRVKDAGKQQLHVGGKKLVEMKDTFLSYIPGMNGLPYGEAEYLGFSDPGSEHVIRHGWKRVE